MKVILVSYTISDAKSSLRPMLGWTPGDHICLPRPAETQPISKPISAHVNGYICLSVQPLRMRMNVFTSEMMISQSSHQNPALAVLFE